MAYRLAAAAALVELLKRAELGRCRDTECDDAVWGDAAVDGWQR